MLIIMIMGDIMYDNINAGYVRNLEKTIDEFFDEYDELLNALEDDEFARDYIAIRKSKEDYDD